MHREVASSLVEVCKIMLSTKRDKKGGERWEEEEESERKRLVASCKSNYPTLNPVIPLQKWKNITLLLSTKCLDNYNVVISSPNLMCFQASFYAPIDSRWWSDHQPLYPSYVSLFFLNKEVPYSLYPHTHTIPHLRISLHHHYHFLLFVFCFCHAHWPFSQGHY